MKPRSRCSSADLDVEFEKAKANGTAGVLNDPDSLYAFVTASPDIRQTIRAYEATRAAMVKHRTDLDFMAMIESRIEALNSRPAAHLMNGEEFLAATRHFVE